LTRGWARIWTVQIRSKGACLSHAMERRRARLWTNAVDLVHRCMVHRLQIVKGYAIWTIDPRSGGPCGLRAKGGGAQPVAVVPGCGFAGSSPEEVELEL
jgi:hypothetical protein